MIALLIIIAIGMTVQYLLTSMRLNSIEKKIREDNLTFLKAGNFIMDKVIEIESKMNGLPYKKRQRKTKEVHENT